MRTRATLLVIGLLWASACGVTEPVSDASPDADPVVTTPSTEQERTGETEEAVPPTSGISPTTTTAPDFGEDPTQSDFDLVEALPVVADLPAGFHASKPGKIPAAQSGIDQVPFDASPACAEVPAPVDATALIEGGKRHSFVNLDNMSVTAMAQAPHERDVAAFEELIELFAACPSFTRSDLSDGVLATVETRSLDLAGGGYVADITLTSSGNGFEFSMGYTVAASMRGNILFMVQVVDGFTGADVVPRDPQLAVDLAAVVDARLSEFVFD